MIINIIGRKNRHGKLEYELPVLLLDRRFGYKIGLWHLNIEFQATSIIKDNELYSLCSNLIDRSPNNTMQSLFNFAIVNRKSIQNWQTSSIIYHKLQLYDFSNSTFQITKVFDETKSIDITNIFLQLEILKLDAYGRLQQ